MDSIGNYIRILGNTLFPNRETVSLFIGALVFVIGMYYFIDVVFPVLVSIVIAFILYEPAKWLQRRGMPNFVVSIFFVLLLFGIIILFFVFVIPLLWQESLQLIKLLPKLNNDVQVFFQKNLGDITIIETKTINDFIAILIAQVTASTQKILSFSFSSLVSIMWAMLYSLLVPILVFFFLYDSEAILARMNVLRGSNPLLQTIWTQTLVNLMYYMRGKIIEFVIVSLASYIALAIFSTTNAFIIGIATGVAVLIPYVGATAVAVFLVAVGLHQWGFEPTFFYAIFAYGVVQVLDAYVLVPLLFSKSLNLRPVTVLISILLFAGIWGMWGVLVAIPFATFIKVVIGSWPSNQSSEKSNVSQ